ncbi:MAG: radical SAM family heme chaperone HemW [Chloroflexi bacterium]|nr:radical SAM family heme chaperone HemW [Chloroflexota bacterium]
MPDDIALYIHIPFCRRKCNYCSFISYPHRDADIPAYVEALKQELGLRIRGKSIRSIYFGGGTPSLLSARQLNDILATISSLGRVNQMAEITIEANPGTVSEPYFRDIRALGVNRLSLGIQSLNDAELALIGRIHTAAEAREAVSFAHKAGFNNLNLDFIYGLPKQTLNDWQKTLTEAMEIGAEHLSLYCLTLEDGVPLWGTIKRGDLPDTDHDLSADQYEMAEDLLAESGYRHYEISNWARPGYECRHNLTYWDNSPYLGIGAAAHSFLNGRRLANTPDIDKYLDAFVDKPEPVLDLNEEISPELQLAETVILGLRQCQGIYHDDIQRRFGIDLLKRYRRELTEMVNAGLLEYDNRCLRLSRRGRLLSNEVFWRLLPE